MGKNNEMSCSGREIKARMRGAGSAQGSSAGDAGEDTEPPLAVLAGLPGHQPRVGSAQVPGAPRRVHGEGRFATILGFAPTSPSMRRLPGRAWGHRIRPVPTKRCHCCWGGGGCRAAGSAAVKPRRSSRQGRRPTTPTLPGSNSTSASTATSCTPAGTP